MIKPAEKEAAGEQEQVEAWFKELSDDSGGQLNGISYRPLYLQWLKQPMLAHEAYLQRAVMNIRAKCYLQVSALLCYHTSAGTCLSAFLLANSRQPQHVNAKSILGVTYCGQPYTQSLSAT